MRSNAFWSGDSTIPALAAAKVRIFSAVERRAPAPASAFRSQMPTGLELSVVRRGEAAAHLGGHHGFLIFRDYSSASIASTLLRAARSARRPGPTFSQPMKANAARKPIRGISTSQRW